MFNETYIREKLNGKHFLVVESADGDWESNFKLYFDEMNATFDYVDETIFLNSEHSNESNFSEKFDGIIIHLVAGGYFDDYKNKALGAKILGIPTVVTLSFQTTRSSEVSELQLHGLGVMLKNSSFSISTILELLVSQME